MQLWRLAVRYVIYIDIRRLKVNTNVQHIAIPVWYPLLPDYNDTRTSSTVFSKVIKY